MYNDKKISFNEIISLLIDMHFIYKDKEKSIRPYLPIMQHTWDILLRGPRDVVSHTILSSCTSISAICSSWRSSANCWCIQNGMAYNIWAYVRAIVTESSKLLTESSASFIQTWYRPDNVVVRKMCGFESPLCNIDGVYSDLNYCLQWEPQNGSEDEFTDLFFQTPETADKIAFRDFVINNRSSLFYEGENIENDPSFDNVNIYFLNVGLTHTRRIDVISSSDEIQAVVLSYFSSPGINFSFLENRTEVIVGKNVDISSRLVSMIGKIVRKNNRKRVVPGPLITGSRMRDVLVSNGAFLQREYVRCIWTREAYRKLYEYITNQYM